MQVPSLAGAPPGADGARTLGIKSVDHDLADRNLEALEFIKQGQGFLDAQFLCQRHRDKAASPGVPEQDAGILNALRQFHKEAVQVVPAPGVVEELSQVAMLGQQAVQGRQPLV